MPPQLSPRLQQSRPAHRAVFPACFGAGASSVADGRPRWHAAVAEQVSAEKGEVLTVAPGVGLRPFSFAHVHEAAAAQQTVYETTGRAAVAELLNGQSGCVLVYGQTGSGKTYTMFGEGEADSRLPDAKRGLVPQQGERAV